jgi:FHS family Na+ dependent glucose MFS transporter 1
MNNRLRTDDETDSDISDLEELDLKLPDNTNAKKIKWRQTVCYYLSYISEGYTWGCIGPTLLLLAEQVGASQEEMGNIFVARGLGWIVGSLMAAKAYDTIKGHRIMFAGSILMALMMGLMPFVTSKWLLYIVSGVLAVFLAWVDVGCNTLLFSVWREEVGPYMQFLHFCFGVGSSVAPFIIAGVMKLAPKGTEVYYSFLILAVLILIKSFPLLFAPSPEINKAEEKEANGSDSGKCMKKDQVPYVVMVGTISTLLFIYVGAEVTYGGWIYTYAVKVYDISPPESAIISSAFWGAITIGRLIAVPITAKVKSSIILLSNLVGSLVCIAILLFFDSLLSRILLWILTIGYGLTMSSVYATAFAIPAQNGVTITSRASSAFVISGAIGEVTIPTVVGFLITGLSRSAFLTSILVMHLVLIVLYFVMVYYLIPLSTRNSKSYSSLNAKQIPESVELGVITSTDDDIHLAASAEL